MENNKEKTSIGDKINDFIRTRRKQIFIIFGALIVLFAGVIAYFIISDSMNKKAIAEVSDLSEEYDRCRFGGENTNFFSSEINALLEKTLSFAKNKKGFAGSKAWSIIGHIYSSREDWPRAEEAWLASARAGVKTYLGPIAYFQAASAAEEQNKFEDAINYLQLCVSHNFEFPDAPRAQFNIGRLYEKLGDYSAALNAYRAVLINWPWDRTETVDRSMLIWQNLARNQIILLEIR